MTTPSPKLACTTSSPVANESDGLGLRAPARRAAERPAGERLLLGALALDQLVGQLGEEARREAGLAPGEHPAAARVCHPEPLAGPRDADVGEPALLLLVSLLERARVREDALLAADDEDGVVLQALGVVEGHQRDLGLVALQVVLVGVERDRLQELLERRSSDGPSTSRLASNSAATPTSSSRFSILPSASIVRSARSASR